MTPQELMDQYRTQDKTTLGHKEDQNEGVQYDGIGSIKGDEGDDEFRRLQEESSGLGAGRQQPFWAGKRSATGALLKRLEGVLSKRAKSGWNGRGDTVWTVKGHEFPRLQEEGAGISPEVRRTFRNGVRKGVRRIRKHVGRRISRWM